MNLVGDNEALIKSFLGMHVIESKNVARGSMIISGNILIVHDMWSCVTLPFLIADAKHAAQNHLHGLIDQLCTRFLDGCCGVCDGTGIDYGAPETNGKCWDCLGTGHPHA